MDSIRVTKVKERISKLVDISDWTFLFDKQGRLKFYPNNDKHRESIFDPGGKKIEDEDINDIATRIKLLK
jgi:hypothetical protein